MPAKSKRTYTTLGIDPRLEAKGEAPSYHFPMFLFLLAVTSLSGAYYFLFVISPAPLYQMSDGEGLAAILSAGMGRLILPVAAHPVISLALFVGLLAPGVINYQKSRQYFLAVVLGSFLVGGGTMVFAASPARDLGKAIHTFIDSSSQRELPELTAGSRG